jgi:hypothetical protein
VFLPQSERPSFAPIQRNWQEVRLYKLWIFRKYLLQFGWYCINCCSSTATLHLLPFIYKLRIRNKLKEVLNLGITKCKPWNKYGYT